MRFWHLFLFIILSSFYTAYGQQDMDLHLTGTFLSGKNILKVKRDFCDPYLWILAQNNEVYRMNSLTFDIDDYTSQFSSYNNMQFIDIAGRSKDSVYIATNSTNVIAYKKGTLSIIGALNGVRGIVNSIGIDYLNTYLANGGGGYSGNVLLIATDNGLCHYDYKAESMLAGSTTVASKVFESTYRKDLFSFLEFGIDPDPALLYPVVCFQQSEYGYFGIYGGALWYKTQTFGYNLNSAFFTSGLFLDNGNAATYMNLFWGTEKGLFQNNRNYSRNSGYPYNHYLDGVNVNKVTSIYGLLPFGSATNPGLVKENLLIGTDDGLYFSNSGYQKPSPQSIFKYDIFHLTDLGTKKINDICVNANSYNYPPQNVDKPTQLSACEDGVWVGAFDGLYFLTPDYLPYINNSQKLLSAINFEGADFQKSEIQSCSITSIKIDINTHYYGSNFIQWYKNGVSIPNETKNILTTTQPGEYYAIVYDPCTPIHFETNHLKITVTAAPVFTFNYPDKINYCEGSTAILQTDNNTNYSYRWYKDGVLNGNTSALLNTTTAGKYKLEVSSCTGNWVSTKEVEVNFIKISQPTITPEKTAYCQGEPAILGSNFIVTGPYTITWLRDGIAMPDNQDKTAIIVTQPGNYTLNISSNVTDCSKTSTPYSLTFEDPPTITLERMTTATLCDGQTVDLKATYSGGTIKWSTGETTANINVKRSGTYTASVKTLAGCEISKDIDVQFLPKPILSVPDATLCQFVNQSITLTAPAGFVKYEWNGQSGTSTFSTNQLGKVTLIVTDNNGCKASQTINITSHCDDIHIPNTFTPNGDGINDTWTITGLEGDVSTTVKVYNRYGANVFQSIGYATPWDGTMAGKKLPAGVYYYVISRHQGDKVFSGSITIIY